MRLLLYARTWNLLVPRGWQAGIFGAAFLLCLCALAANTNLEAQRSVFSVLVFTAAILTGSMLLSLESAPLSFCLPDQQRVLRRVVMIVGFGSCTGFTALTRELMALNKHHALYTEFLAGPVFWLLLMQGLAFYFLVLSLQLAVTCIAVEKRLVGIVTLLLSFSLPFYDHVGRTGSLAMASTGAAACAALCGWLLGLRSVARNACQGGSSAPAGWFQVNLWRDGAFESALFAAIRRFGRDPWRGGFFESLYLTLSGATARNVLLALLACLYFASTLPARGVRQNDLLVFSLMPLCFPVFLMKTMFSPWLPISRVQRFVQSLLQGAFHYLLALFMVLLVRAVVSLLVWGFPDALWHDYAKDVVDMPLKIVFLCGLFALIASFFHVAVPSTIVAVICSLFIGLICGALSHELVRSFFSLDVVGAVLVSVVSCVPFVLACAYRSFRADLRESKKAMWGF